MATTMGKHIPSREVDSLQSSTSIWVLLILLKNNHTQNLYVYISSYLFSGFNYNFSYESLRFKMWL